MLPGMGMSVTNVGSFDDIPNRTPLAAINQFNKTLDKNQAETLFKLLLKYRPESRMDKRTRLLAEAEARTGGKVRNVQSPGMNSCHSILEGFHAS
jgi:hypothetical protein